MSELLSRLKENGNPIIDENQATIVWQGDVPPRLVGDFNNWEASEPLLHAAAPGLWAYTLTLQPDAYIEYAFISNPETEERIPDPYNPRVTFNGIRHYNHYFYMPQGSVTTLTQVQRGLARGLITHHHIKNTWLVANHQRRIHLYHPPVDEACPLLVVFDGKDYLKRALLPRIVDHLIAQKRIRPIALALVDNGDAARTVEYSCSEATLGFLLFDVVPLAQQNLNLLPPESGTWGVLGASLGGLMALFSGLRVPQVFRQVLSQSGAFKYPGYESVNFDLVRNGPKQPLRIWMDVGLYEGLLPGNREMAALLNERGYEVNYREYSAGHNFPAWRDDIHHGLETLYAR